MDKPFKGSLRSCILPIFRFQVSDYFYFFEKRSNLNELLLLFLHTLHEILLGRSDMIWAGHGKRLRNMINYCDIRHDAVAKFVFAALREDFLRNVIRVVCMFVLNGVKLLWDVDAR
jgi:hypothetical protein